MDLNFTKENSAAKIPGVHSWIDLLPMAGTYQKKSIPANIWIKLKDFI